MYWCQLKCSLIIMKVHSVEMQTHAGLKQCEAGKVDSAHISTRVLKIFINQNKIGL